MKEFYNQCWILKNSSIGSFLSNLINASPCGTDNIGLEKKLSVPNLGQANWIKASISLKFWSFSSETSDIAINWVLIPSLFKSQIADRFVSHPSDVVSVGMQVQVTVLEIDKEREKVSLSMKTGQSSGQPATPRVNKPAPIERPSTDTGIKNGIVWG